MSDNSYLISFVVPVYNAEDTIEICFNSIICQQGADFEIILIDDASLDNSLNVCRELAKDDPRIRVIVQEDKGVSETRNHGIREAQGKYIVFVDSDDQLDMNYVSSIVCALSKYGEDNVFVNAIEKINAEKTISMHYADEEISMIPKERFLKLNQSFLFNSPCNKLYKRSILAEHKLTFSTQYSLGEDMLFNIQYFMKAQFQNVIVLNKVKYKYIYLKSNSLSHKYIQDYFESHMFFMRELKKIMVQMNVPQEDYKIYEGILWGYFELSMKNTMRIENTMEFWQKMKYNNQIMKHELFQYALQNAKDKLPRSMYYAYKTGKFYIVHSVTKIRNIRMQ